MQKTTLVALLAFVCGTALGQERAQKDLPHFNKIVASPRINVVLEKGDQESIRLVCNNVPVSKVNVTVSGHKLQIYLDHARMVEKQEYVQCDEHRHRDGRHKRSIYHDASVTAYVTYKELRQIEVRGEQEFTCQDNISADKLKLTAYGEADITLAGVQSKKFKVSLFGENKLTVNSGATDRQVYRLIGENKINTRALASSTALTRIIGEGRLSLAATSEVSIRAIGEPEIRVAGSPVISKGMILGHARIVNTGK